MCTDKKHTGSLSLVSHSLLVDLGVSLAPSSHVYKCKSRPCTGRLVWVSVELTIYSGSLPIFFSPVRSDGEHWRVLFSVKNAVTRLSQEKSLFSSLELAPLVFEVSTHKLNPTHSNPILVPQIRNIFSGATDWYLLIAFFGDVYFETICYRSSGIPVVSLKIFWLDHEDWPVIPEV